MRPVAEQAAPGFGASPAADAVVGGAQSLTFLFTDIEGSTALLRRAGEDVYAQVLAGHHAIIRSGLAGHGGREVDTAGDGFFAVLPSPRACVAAAVEMQQALQAHAWPDGERVRVRMGVHTGEASRAATGLVGLDVHRAARVAAVGYGGQVLVSETAAALVRDRLPPGAMRITGPGIWGDPPGRDRAKEALRRAVALDVTFIDTADSYGPEVSEHLIAETLYPYPEELVIATKGGLVRPGPGQWVPDGRPEHLRGACEGSLRRLRLDRIDLYQFHRPDPRVPIAESIGALAELKDEGKIRHVGVSNVTEDQFREAERVTPIVSVQNRYNVADRSSEPMLDLCDQEMLVFIPWAPIEETGAIPALMAAARRRGVSERQVALAWLLTRSPQVLPIPGSGNPEHVEENVAAASIELTAEEIRAITLAVLSR